MTTIAIKRNWSESNGTVAIKNKYGLILNNEYSLIQGEEAVCDRCGLIGLNTYEDLAGEKFCVQHKGYRERTEEQLKLGMSDRKYRKYRQARELAGNTDDGTNQKRFGIAFNE